VSILVFSVLHSAARLITWKYVEVWPYNTDTSGWSLLVASTWEDSFYALFDHLQVSPSNFSAVPPGVVSYSWYKSPPSTLCCSWRLASASLPHVQFWTTQLCCLCSKTVELYHRWSYTFTDLKQAKDTSFRFGLWERTRDCDLRKL